jgi:hypothetical protein
MSTTRETAIRAVQMFAAELVRTPLYECGHADGWERVARATTFEELLLGLGYSAGYAGCARVACPWDSPSWRIADALENAAKTFAALLRAPMPIDVSRCVATYRAELLALLALDRRGNDRKALTR